MNITEFLQGRFAEERDDALALEPVYDGLVATIHTSRIAMYALAPHFAHWDPARVIAECEAKQRLLDLHPTYAQEPYRIEGGQMYYPPDPYYCDCQCPDGIIQGHEPCPTKRFLALPYVNDRDYREEWRP